MWPGHADLIRSLLRAFLLPSRPWPGPPPAPLRLWTPVRHFRGDISEQVAASRLCPCTAATAVLHLVVKAVSSRV